MFSTAKVFSAKRRGIDKAVASVILISTFAILISTVSIMGEVLIGRTNSNPFTKQATLESSFAEKMNKLNEDLLVEQVWFGTSPNILTVTPNNVGTIGLNVTLGNIGILGLNVTTIRVTNVTAGNTTDFDYDYTDLGVIKSESISQNVTYPWKSGDELDILVFTGRSNQFTTQVVAP